VVSKEDPVTRPDQPPLGSAIGLAQEIADHFAKVYERTADVLENSAAIAERIAERQERSGRSEAAKECDVKAGFPGGGVAAGRRSALRLEQHRSRHAR